MNTTKIGGLDSPMFIAERRAVAGTRLRAANEQLGISQLAPHRLSS